MERHRLQVVVAALVVTSIASSGCHRGQQGPDRLPTVPVKGSVTVDGLPAPALTVKFHALHPVEGESQIYAANPTALTDPDGSFVASTYQRGDGIAAGEYAITFEWLTYNFIQNSYGGPDKLGGRYSDPAKTEFKLSVTGDEETGIDLGEFRLEKSTQGEKPAQ